jgi:hypothetical protein
MRRFGRIFQLGLLILVAIVLSRCSQTNKTGTGNNAIRREPGTFSDVYTNTLSQACVQCHVPGTATSQVSKVKLNFTTQQTAYQTLVASTVSGVTSSGICAGVKIVVPRNPDNSYLSAVLFSDYDKTDFAGVPGCVPYSLHQQDQNLSAEEKNSVLLWIQNGALNN